MANYVLKADLRIGDKFGLLTVLEESESRFYIDKRDGYTKRIRRVKCKCDCGKEVIRDYGNLPKQQRRGQVSCCGCNKNKVKEITKDITPIPNSKKLPHIEKRRIVTDLINQDYMSKEIILKTGFSSGFITEVRANIGKSMFKIKREIRPGEKHNRITIIERVKNKSVNRRSTIVLGKCDCGTIKEFNYNHLQSGHIKSCGCLMIETARNMMKTQLIPKNTVHGDSSRKKTKHSYIYQIWMGMKQRCYEKNNKRYSTYGARGLTVYEPWINNYPLFKEWILTNLGERKTSDTGKRSDNESLDRIDVNIGYHPGNLRWADFITQSNNKVLKTNGHKTRPILESETGDKMLPTIELRKVYEEYYGVKVKKGNVIHHINWDASDNSKGNLLEVSRKEHGWLHRTVNYELRNKSRMDIIDILKDNEYR